MNYLMKIYFQKRMASFKFAFRGLALLFNKTPNARIHLLAFTIALIIGMYFNISLVEWCSILTVSALVLGLEAVNSALETTLNHLHPSKHNMIGQAKDLAAAAVLIAAIFALSVGTIIFAPHIYNALQNY